MTNQPDLSGKVAAVTGATRGAGRAIAVQLGAAGATVYCGGRTTREQKSDMGRAETIEETAELVTAAGGEGIAIRCDFTVPSDVDAFAARIDRLDVLVDDVWGGESLVEDGPFWEQDLDRQLKLWRNSVESHLVALHRLMPILVRSDGGLLVEVTDGDDDEVYHGNLTYDLVKRTVRRLGKALAKNLDGTNVTSVAATPGFLRSEQMLEYFGVTEENWRDGIAKDAHYVMSETPHYLGRGIAHLAADPDRGRFAGRCLSSWGLMREYGFTDLDGTRPDWGRWFADVVETGTDPSTVDASRYR